MAYFRVLPGLLPLLRLLQRRTYRQPGVYGGERPIFRPQPRGLFIFTASGTDDFAYSGFKRGVMDMGTDSEIFTFGDSETEGNLSFREREGYAHNGTAANEYMYNALRFFWNKTIKQK